eukprot:scaffold596997_cov24-Prasinocladus_malaysianus.AAC.1
MHNIKDAITDSSFGRIYLDAEGAEIPWPVDTRPIIHPVLAPSVRSSDGLVSERVASREASGCVNLQRTHEQQVDVALDDR